MRVKEKDAFFLEGFALIRARAGPIRAYMDPYGPIWALMGLYGPEKSQKIHKQFAFIGAFKGPCLHPALSYSLMDGSYQRLSAHTTCHSASVEKPFSPTA